MPAGRSWSQGLRARPPAVQPAAGFRNCGAITSYSSRTNPAICSARSGAPSRTCRNTPKSGRAGRPAVSAWHLGPARFFDMRHIGLHREAGADKGGHVTPVICKIGHFPGDACCIQRAHYQRHEDAFAFIGDRQGAGGKDGTVLGRKLAQRRAMQTFTRARIVRFGCQDDIHCPLCKLLFQLAGNR